jgi:putative spermidine/putrescine transport system substrate-binding protein
MLERSALGGLGLASLGAMSTVLESPAFAAESDASGGMAQLIAAAKKEGHLNVITLPRDWANYGEIMDTFSKKYGISIADANPLGTSAQEVQAIKSLKGQSRGPDVVDVSPVYADIGKKGGLYVPYKVSTWSSVPGTLKDPKAYWTGDYWGAEAILSVDEFVKPTPKSFQDLLNPAFKNKVAINGDPRQAGEAFGAVMAASLANGGSLDDIGPGVDFFVKLYKMGNFNPTKATPAAMIRGETPIAIRWDYLLLADRDEAVALGINATVTIPSDGVYGGYYCQAISKYAPNPNAAKLWLEYLYSDTGQLLFLKGYTHPVRYQDLAKRKKVPKALAAKLPAASLYKKAQFANLTQINKAAAVLNARWKEVAGS